MKIRKSDFTFQYKGLGYYLVSYKGSQKMINDMTLIDDVRNEDDPDPDRMMRLRDVIRLTDEA